MECDQQPLAISLDVNVSEAQSSAKSGVRVGRPSLALRHPSGTTPLCFQCADNDSRITIGTNLYVLAFVQFPPKLASFD